MTDLNNRRKNELFCFREILADIREPLLDASMALAFAMAVVFIFRYFTLWKLVLGKTSC